MSTPLANPRRIPPDTYLFFFVLFAAVVYLGHSPFLNLPYYWDELGQFIPAAQDILHSGSWVPHSAVPNVHPPGVMAWLALAWTAAGESSLVTRAAMLLLASASVLVVFLLAIQLCRDVPGTPALYAALLLLVSPLFWAQSMLAQLDMPAMLFTCLALLLFLQDKPAPVVAAACTALVLVKETGVLVPVLLGAWWWHEGRRRDAAWFLVPCAGLLAWILYLKHATGYSLGSASFTQYNLFYSLHPVRAAMALLRRIWYLFAADFRWIGTIAIVWGWRRGVLKPTRAWRIAATLVAVNVAVLSAFGGAALERYLLPVLPLVLIAMAAATAAVPRRWRMPVQLALLAGTVSGLFWNPPYPFPPENNLAFTDFVKLQDTAAGFLAGSFPEARIATAWPLAPALAHPELGYVERGLHVRTLPDFYTSTIAAADWSNVDVFVIFSHLWDPYAVTTLRPVRWFWTRFYGYQPDIDPAGVRERIPLEPVARWSRRGQWIEVYVRPGLRPR